MLLQGCGNRGGAGSVLPAAKMETPKSVSPASVPAAPMARTAVLPSSVMTSIRVPKSAIQPIGWTQLPGGAISVAAAPDGSIWVLSSQGSGPDRSIWHYVSGTWTNIPGAAARLAVAPDNTLWAVNSAGGIYAYANGAWSTIAGGASEITVGPDGSVYVISNQGGGPYGRGIWRYSGGSWTQLPGAATKIAAYWDTGTYSPNIAPGGFFVVNAGNSVFYYNPSSGFAQLPGGVVQIAPTKTGGVFALGYAQNADGSYPIYYDDLNANTWTQQPGAAISISANSDALYAVGVAGGIYSAAIVPMPGTATFTLSPGGPSSITGTRRRPKYVSTATSSITIVANGNGTPTILNLGDPAHCDAAGNCSISLTVPAGPNAFTVSAYDGTDGSGALLSRATVQAKIASSGTTVVPAVLEGNVASITMTLSTPNPPLHQSSTIPITVIAKDPDGNTIVGPGGYMAGISLTNSDTSGHTSLSATQLNGPNDTASLQYDGGYAAGTITASSSTASTSASAQFFPTAAAAEWTLPSGHTTGDIINGPDGALWFTARPGSIGRVTTAGSITEYALPANWNPVTLCGTSDGVMWIIAQSTQNATYAMIRRATDGTFTVYPGVSGSTSFAQVVLGPDGNFWFVAYGAANRITTSGAWSQPSLHDKNGNPITVYAVNVGPDGALWFTSIGALVRYDVTAGTAQLYPLKDAYGNPLTPGQMVLGPDSRFYFGTVSSLIAFDPTAGTSTTVGKETNGVGIGLLTFAPDQGLWFSSGPTMTGNWLFGRMVGSVQVPILGSVVQPGGTFAPGVTSFETGPDGALWYTRGSAIGRMSP